MKIIHNDKEFEEIYYYRDYYKKNKKRIPDEQYPKPEQYPCVVEYVYEEGGIGGSYTWHRFTKIPKNVDHKSFLLGYKAVTRQHGY